MNFFCGWETNIYIRFRFFWGGGVDECVLWLSELATKMLAGISCTFYKPCSRLKCRHTHFDFSLTWADSFPIFHDRHGTLSFHVKSILWNCHFAALGHVATDPTHFSRQFNQVKSNRARVAIFLWVQHTKTGKNMPNNREIYQITVNLPNGHKICMYTKWPQNIPNGQKYTK
jgi:hypothetical protein